MEASTLEQFRSALSAMAKQFESGYPKPSTFDDVLSGIREFRNEAMNPLMAHFKKGRKDFVRDLDALLNPMFHADPDAGEALQRLAEDARHRFMLQKSYQISHASGWIDHNPPQSSTVAAYFRLQIFADHLESLNKRLAYILKRYHKKEVPGSYGGYKCLKEHQPQACLNEIDVVRDLAWIRNAINHGDSVCTREGVSCLIRHTKHKIKETSWDKLEIPMNLIVQYSILLATEIDYRSFKHAKGKDNLKPDFKPLFDLYKDAFFHGQNLT